MTKEIEIDSVHSEFLAPKYKDYNVQIVENIDYIDFFNKFMVQNLPCIIKDVAKAWKCSTNWIIDNNINYEYLTCQFGHLNAPVANCAKFMYNSQCNDLMKVSEYIEYMQDTNKSELLYLKDWHLWKTILDADFYEVPQMFAADWLNEFAQDHNSDDYRFVYIGPKKSWTPLHADVYGSYSWSVNVIGRKKWILIPPGEEEKIKDPLGNFPHVLSKENLEALSHLEVIQERGDALFVPSGWYHQVENLLDTISINHNWINACNVKFVWMSLETCLKNIENEIIEFKDTPEYVSQCQLILKSVYGMDLKDFVNFVCYIASKRVKQYEGTNTPFILDNYKIGNNHILHDLTVLLQVLNTINNHHLPKYPDIVSNCDIITNIEQSISQILNTSH